MKRTFSQHKIRKMIALPDIWKFHVKGANVTSMPVPCCIETNPELVSYKGPFTYETEFEAGGCFRIEFAGISHTASIYLDDCLLGSHYGAYGAFSFVLTGRQNGVHHLRVDGDNSYHEDSSLHVPNDYYSYGGITRPVTIEKLDTAYIKAVRFRPYCRDGQWYGSAMVTVANLTTQELPVCIDLSLHTCSNRQMVTLKALEEQTICFDTVYPDITPYSPCNPALYYINVILSSPGRSLDDYIDRTGFREVRVEGQNILFNGEILTIKGFNRHEDFGDFGCCVPLQAMYRDLELIKGMGANCIRTCHYPNDERWLDLCDENGILVWEEAHARGLSQERMMHPLFMEQSLLSVEEMISQHYNHPSIYVWGLLNECCDFTDYGRQCYETLIHRIRELDDSRPVTYATCHFGEQICLDLVDIVSMNMYPGWYSLKTPEVFLADALDWICSCGGYGKPVLISEIGAGAVYGFRSNTKAKWSEERQSLLLESQITAVLSNSRISGIILWQFCDCRVDEDIFASRPKTENNKGIVDIYRREKLACETVKRLFRIM